MSLFLLHFAVKTDRNTETVFTDFVAKGTKDTKRKEEEEEKGGLMVSRYLGFFSHHVGADFLLHFIIPLDQNHWPLCLDFCRHLYTICRNIWSL